MADRSPPSRLAADRPAAPAAVPAPGAVALPAIAHPSGSAELGRLLGAIVESSDDAILTKDLNGIITSWNAGAEQMYGYAAEEVIGQPVSILVPTEFENDVPRLMGRLRQGERIQHYETTRVARDGRRLSVSLSISPIHDEKGQIIASWPGEGSAFTLRLPLRSQQTGYS